MTRARVKALHDKVNSRLYAFDLGSTLDGLLLHADTLCILRYEPLHRLHGSMSNGREDGQENTQQKQTDARTGAAGPYAEPFGATPGAPNRRRTAYPRALLVVAEPSGAKSGPPAQLPNHPEIGRAHV